MPSRSSRPSAAIAKHTYHSLPGRPSIGCAMSAVTCFSVGDPVIHRGSATPSGRLSMTNLLEVRHVGPGTEILEDTVGTLAAHALREAAVRVVEIAEHDRVGRTDLLAGRLDLAVLDRLAGLDRGVLGDVDALDAEAALLHHAARPHRSEEHTSELQSRLHLVC